MKKTIILEKKRNIYINIKSDWILEKINGYVVDEKTSVYKRNGSCNFIDNKTGLLIIKISDSYINSIHKFNNNKELQDALLKVRNEKYYSKYIDQLQDLKENFVIENGILLGI